MKFFFLIQAVTLAAVLTGCGAGQKTESVESPDSVFTYFAEQFADLRVLRYQVPGFDRLTPRQKELAYYLYEAALAGRDITWDQHYKHNLCIRRTLENIYLTYGGDRKDPGFEKFVVYLKRVWFSSGIHHHYSTIKLDPGFPADYFAVLVRGSDPQGFPLAGGETVEGLIGKLTPVLFDPKVDAKRVNLASDVDLVTASANNFYEGVTQAEVEAYYDKAIDRNDPRPVSYGLNSKLVKENGVVTERVWKAGGMYGAAIGRIVQWLEKAASVAENDLQRAALEKLVEYYRSGNLRNFDEYNVLWVQDTSSTLDVINGFIETYGDPLGFRATYESTVELKDFEATRRIEAIARQAQWFEDNSPIAPEHKKANVTGISARVIEAVVEAGAVSPSSPIGINLPNANWIRAEHGSKSV
ncbi:MAG: dihydrofolate reductase, partial [Candidatus Glassbacteria bacterium]